jgi:hypothetical protein
MEIPELILEILSFPSSSAGKSREGKKSRAQVLAFMLLVSGTLWLLLEVHTIRRLTSPVTFVALSLLACIAGAVLLVVLLFRLKLVGPFRPADFLLVILTLSLNLVCATSYLNRKTDYRKTDYKLMPPSEKSEATTESINQIIPGANLVCFHQTVKSL